MKTLFKQADAVAAKYDVAGSGLWELEGGEGWELLSFTANDFSCRYQGYFDLAGMSVEDKTIFFRDIQVQLQTLPYAANGIVGDNVTIQLYVTDQPMDGMDYIGPGFAYSKMNAENCLIHRTQQWTITQDTAGYGSIMQLTGQTSNGMMRATASDRLYYAIWVQLNALLIGPGPTSTLEGITIPGHRIVIDVDAKEEPDHQYIMRLLRSYELNQTS